MARPGTIERQRAADRRRASARIRLNLDVAASARGEETRALIHDLSSSGVLIETDAALSLGSELIVALPEAGDVPAKVVWQSEKLFGCRFDRALGRAALGAAQLRNPLPRDLGLAERSGETAAPQSLPEKLLRLRQERGLSRSEVAARTGVSTPTIWAWEVGKTRPREQNLLALANALGTTESELRAGGERREAHSPDDIESQLGGANESKRLRNFLDEKRVQVAEMFGVEANKVKIVIEF
jgi:transcriptional regulator with XRE-family HTH domain